MDGLFKAGRWCFALAFAAFGVEYAVLGRFLQGLPLFPPWVPGGQILPRVVGISVLAAGLGVLVNTDWKKAATLLGGLLLGCAAFLYLPWLATSVRDPGPWTMGAEALCLCGGAFVLASAARSKRVYPPLVERAIAAGNPIFAAPLLVFGAQHFLYSRFISTLIPEWIPGRPLWPGFVGAAFVAAALSIGLDVKRTLGAALLSAMLLSWVFIVHLPRIAAAPEKVDEWTSGLVALAVGGAALVVAAVSARRSRAPAADRPRLRAVDGAPSVDQAG